MEKVWSLEELAEESQRFVDDGESRRVQWKPSGRQIRYYSTLGLLDKPDTENGRTVWYGPRHLLQLLAIKHLQQEGLKLAEIQQTLAGSTPRQLQSLVGLPDSFLETLDNSVKKPVSPRRSTDFWAQPPAAAPAVKPGPQFQASVTLEISAGVTLTLDAKHFQTLDDQGKRELAEAFLDVWQNHKKKKENP